MVCRGTSSGIFAVYPARIIHRDTDAQRNADFDLPTFCLAKLTGDCRTAGEPTEGRRGGSAAQRWADTTRFRNGYLLPEQRVLASWQRPPDSLCTPAAHLQSYPAAVDMADPALFVDEARKPLTYRRWKRLLTDARTAAGVEVTSHSFRHFAASALICSGASVKQAQTFLGHASAVITLRNYAHMWPGDEDRTRNVLDAALSVLEHNPKMIRTVDGQ